MCVVKGEAEGEIIQVSKERRRKRYLRRGGIRRDISIPKKKDNRGKKEKIGTVVKRGNFTVEEISNRICCFSFI